VSASDRPQPASIDVRLLEDGTVLLILLNTPKANIVTAAMMREIEAALAEHRDDAHLRLVVLRGAGGNFSYGASVEEHRKDQAPLMLATFHRLARAIAAYPVPVAALVEGRCLGGAFELVLCCHLVFAISSTRFGCPEIKLGVFPPVLAVAGATRLGSALTERMLLTGDEIDAQTAERAGFATILDAAGDPAEAVLAWYRKVLRPLSAFALRQSVGAVRGASALLAALGDPLAAAERQYVHDVLSSHDGNEGIEAFLARRPPVWRDT
jgi:cyclohexa-1,5-dienecarbonyl-CoA hydratase